MQRNPHSYQIATGYRTFYSLSLIYQPITKKRLFFDKNYSISGILDNLDKLSPRELKCACCLFGVALQKACKKKRRW